MMAANVLKSPAAVWMSVFVVRAFVRMRAVPNGHKDLADKLAELEKKLTERLDLAAAGPGAAEIKTQAADGPVDIPPFSLNRIVWDNR